MTASRFPYYRIAGPAAGALLLCIAISALAAPTQTPASNTGPNNVEIVVNGEPITSLDIEHRSRFLALVNNGKIPGRQEVIDELIDEKLKLQLPKRFDFSQLNLDGDVENALNNMARRRHITQAQLAQDLAARGVPISTLKSRVRAEIIWTQVVRGKYQATLQLNDSEVTKELQMRKKDDKAEPEGFDYNLRPIVFIVPRGSPAAILDLRRRDAETLRSRFQNCNEGIALARTMRDVAVQAPITRSSADLPQALREILEKTDVGRLTQPETTMQGIELYALCGKKASTKENSPAKREVRDEIYSKQFQASAKKFLKELRDQAYIQYK